MDMQTENGHPIVVDNPSDIELNKPSKSRFLFLLFFFGYFIFAWAGCYSLHNFSFHNNKDIAVPDNTKYNPSYK